MANPRFENVDPPFTAFRFEVVLDMDSPLPGVADPVCDGAFSECEGLEMSMEPKTVQEGGNNLVQTHLIGPVRYGQLTLRRGMTATLDLWNWFAAAAQSGHVATAHGHVTMWDADGTPRLEFTLEGCLPTRVRGPSLNAATGLVAVEELQMVYQRMTVRQAGTAGTSAGLGLGFGAAATLSAGVSASVSVSGGPGLSASASASVSLDIG